MESARIACSQEHLTQLEIHPSTKNILKISQHTPLAQMVGAREKSHHTLSGYKKLQTIMNASTARFPSGNGIHSVGSDLPARLAAQR